MFSKILIANRGEIACRIIKTAKKMGISTVAVYSDADKNSLHVNFADEAIYIGASPATESYLVADKIISAARATGAQAIHPGYGFLSENADFSQRCAEQGVVFIGPPAAAIAKMGSKSAAKSIMENAQVPLVPGYHGEDQDPQVIKRSADDMGYPVLLKAVAGGGGKGMRVVESAESFATALVEAKREALSSFDNADVLVEKYLPRARHVEVQVFFDTKGNGVYLFDRDCSIQRRHQKIIEEAPAPGLSDALRKKMGQAALRAAQAIDYVGAGTVEFLLADVKDEQFYFMEMNTRLQVEHPVTEMITGFDLVEWQLRVAAGEHLPVQQDAIRIHGHAFEARIYAEDTEQNFCPSTGVLTYMNVSKESDHIRVDTGFRVGDEISPYYDPMIAKLVSWDTTRASAARLLRKNIEDFHVAGVKTNIPLIHRIFSMPPFLDGLVDTQFIQEYAADLFDLREAQSDVYTVLAALYLLLRRQRMAPSDASPWSTTDHWKLNHTPVQHIAISTRGRSHSIEVKTAASTNASFSLSLNGECYETSGELDRQRLTAEINDRRFSVTVVDVSATEFSLLIKADALMFCVDSPDLGDGDISDSAGGCLAPMNGRIIDILVKEGQSVEKNAALVVMEAMKMEHTVLAPNPGIVEKVFCKKDQLVDGGSELISIASSENP